MKTIKNAVFNVKDFAMPTLLKYSHEMSIWLGNGHTVDTDPTKRGWRMWNIAADPKRNTFEVVLVGRKGKEGCFVASMCDDGAICVIPHAFDLTDHVREVLVTGKNPHGVEGGVVQYIGGRYNEMGGLTPLHSGWALPIIAEIERVNDVILNNNKNKENK